MKHISFLLLSAAVSAHAVTVLPTLGYSSSTGFLLGGYLVSPSGAPGFTTISLDAYYGTAGVLKFQPSFSRMAGRGMVNASVEQRKMLEKSWYGWGNETLPDSAASMDLETTEAIVEYAVGSGEGLGFTLGLTVRHSSVFNRQESHLWDRLPGQVHGSTWTGGPRAGITALLPVSPAAHLTAGADALFQEGDVSYGGVTGRLTLNTFPWKGGEAALGTRFHRHFNTSKTPVPFVPGIGAQNDFRCYDDHRFTGALWAIAQMEVRQLLLTLDRGEENPPLTLTAAVFAEAGETADSWNELSINGLHTGAGCGFRLGVGSGALMRIDAGWGDQGMILTSGFRNAF